ncbi:nitrate reductase associated protein [Oscillatoria sp. CS-180]|uniref:nitrate reductase associated protein n=1 Tax=Oscillatoria sp. CS-180 TaxID=3021720 RepID=UPI002330DF26|nr:nitrate reductase associated protein [Oscillatoria sp. CS-180]MDB9524442.1 nitrate reductase associated protein [Oscillatoria sp. CS-180]
MPTANPTFFQFEADFVQSLRCIPMQVRYKLDTCGIKLKLEHWNKFSKEDREKLVTQPCDTAADIEVYRKTVQALVAKQTETPAKDLPIEADPPWLQANQIPADVIAQAQHFQTTISLDRWAALSPLERFALCKLSRPGHENRNFLPALREFGLAA